MEKESVFSQNLKTYRKKIGMSQKQFADKLLEVTGKKLTLTSISNYETGLHMPPPQILPAIAEILRVSIDALFGVDERFSDKSKDEGEVASYKEELLSLEREFIIWKSHHEGEIKGEVRSVVNNYEKLLSIARSQQEQLVVFQTELATIKELLDFLKK